MVDISALSESILAARQRLAPYIRTTPNEHSLVLSQRYGCEVWLKSEHLQHSGSFKARGALHKLLSLTPAERARGVIAASSGNHGAGIAWAGHTLGMKALVFVPEQASSAKIDMIRRYGAEVQKYGTDGLDTEIYARQVASERGSTYVSPYNDPQVVLGQGTVGVELYEQMPSIDAVIIAVGGGGLIGGTAAYLKSRLPNVRIIGSLPERSPIMAVSVRAGHVVEMPSEPTLSDGTAGGVESDAITFELCQTLVDDWTLVSEEEIARAMREFIVDHHQLIEGSAAVPIAALSRQAGELRGQRVALVLCGGNVSIETLRKVIT